MDSQPLLSIVVPVHNEAACLSLLYRELSRVCDGLNYGTEFIFVDDGSTDATPAILTALRRDDERVKYLRLTRNFGHQAALSAGLRRAAGDAVIMMDGDLQHPPALIPELIERFEAGFEVVNTARRANAGDGSFRRLCSRLFYRVFNRFGQTTIIPGGADFRLLSRSALDSLNALPEIHRFLRGLVPWLGFRQTVVEFDAPPRGAGRSKFNWARRLDLALDGLTAFGAHPLRRIALLGWLIALAGFLYGMFALGTHLFTRRTVPGWTSLTCCVLFLGGCQLLVAGVLGEYLGRILEQVKGRPPFVIREAVGWPEKKGRKKTNRGRRREHGENSVRANNSVASGSENRN